MDGIRNVSKRNKLDTKGSVPHDLTHVESEGVDFMKHRVQWWLLKATVYEEKDLWGILCKRKIFLRESVIKREDFS